MPKRVYDPKARQSEKTLLNLVCNDPEFVKILYVPDNRPPKFVVFFNKIPSPLAYPLSFDNIEVHYVQAEKKGK